MINYVCDWCGKDYPLNGISRVKVKNVYNKAVTVHICRECARAHMPESIQPNLSWTALGSS